MMITLLIVLVVFVFLYKGWQRKAYEEVVHADATTIVKVDLNELIKTLAWDFMGNWSHYSSKDQDSIQSKEKVNRGINLPASVLMYTVPQVSNTIFCTLKISDSIQAVSYVSEKLGLSKEIERKRFYQKSNKRETISLAQLDNTLVLAFSYKKEEISKVFEDILLHKKYMATTHDMLQKLKEEHHHVSITGENGMMLHLDSKDGVIDFFGKLENSSFIDFKESQEVPSFSNKTSIQMYIAGEVKDTSFLKNHLGNEVKIGSTTLVTDSLFRNYNNLITFQIKGSTSQKDSVITYEYNDDFEKIPVVSVEEKTIPNILLSLKVDSTDITEAYLKRSKVIDTAQLIKGMPLYQFYATQKADEFIMSTSKELPLPFQETVVSTDFLSMQVQIEQLIAENHFPVIHSYISSMNIIDIKAKKGDAQTIHVEGMITFKEKKINAITQMLK
ncbi:hypothetical protein [Aquimarina sp. I32.4]|uniref:hypothetical protein n=1 Tax=Aquimarina sp. I32.4 TaxID=2053903 RepID=UPI001E2D53C0|nr:hypothetical protein [Aquimarina sp. I32.4]